MGKGKVLRIFDTKAVFENLETGSCLLVTQQRDSGTRQYEQFNRAHPPQLGITSQVVPFEAIFGIYDLLSGSYVALVVESEPYVKAAAIDIRRCKKILIIPLFKGGRVLSESRQRDEDRYLQLLHLAFNEHNFFFSYSYDITLTQQSQAKLQLLQQPAAATAASTTATAAAQKLPATTVAPAGGVGGLNTLWGRADHRFFWNRELVQDLISNDADEWVLPFMSAYIEVRTDCTVRDTKFTLLFISRRSRYRQGCRFTKRGLDENGNPANFVETEQVLLFADGKVTSYVQVRGSIPLKWMSPVHMKYDPVVLIDEDKEQSADWAERHMVDLVEQYCDMHGNSNIVCVNLIDRKKDQNKLGIAFQEVVDAVRPRIHPTPLQYEWFDFHHECKQKGKWNNLSKLVAKLDKPFKEQKFFSKSGTGQITSWQIGVMRTNCMDNLDRTNVVQSLLARRSLIYQTGVADFPEVKEKGVMETPYAQFEKTFKHVWANNANAMSMGYAGTGALKVDFTRTGKRTLKGMFNDGVNAVMRYYINNFTDGVKQDAIDLLIGNYRPNNKLPSPFRPKASQDALSSNITKAFLLVMIIFSTLLLLLPPSSSTAALDGVFTTAAIAEQNISHMRAHLLVAVIITLLVAAYYAYRITKKGSKIGERMVVHPELCPETLPSGRQQ